MNTATAEAPATAVTLETLRAQAEARVDEIIAGGAAHSSEWSSAGLLLGALDSRHTLAKQRAAEHMRSTGATLETAWDSLDRAEAKIAAAYRARTRTADHAEAAIRHLTAAHRHLAEAGA